MSTREERAAARRASMVLAKRRLGDEEHDFTPVSGVEALSLVTRLTLECWTLRGETCAPLDRNKLEVRLVPFAPRGER